MHAIKNGTCRPIFHNIIVANLRMVNNAAGAADAFLVALPGSL